MATSTAPSRLKSPMTISVGLLGNADRQAVRKIPLSPTATVRTSNPTTTNAPKYRTRITHLPKGDSLSKIDAFFSRKFASGPIFLARPP